MPGLKLIHGLLWVHNNNYIYTVLLSLFLSSFSSPFLLFLLPPSYRHLTADDRAPLCNIILHDLWTKFESTEWGQLSDNRFSITATYYKFIMLIGQQAPSLGRVVLLFPAITRIYKNGDYKSRCPFHSTQYLPDLLHKCRQLPLEFIVPKTLIQNFN